MQAGPRGRQGQEGAKARGGQYQEGGRAKRWAGPRGDQARAGGRRAWRWRCWRCEPTALCCHNRCGHGRPQPHLESQRAWRWCSRTPAKNWSRQRWLRRLCWPCWCRATITATIAAIVASESWGAGGAGDRGDERGGRRAWQLCGDERGGRRAWRWRCWRCEPSVLCCHNRCGHGRPQPHLESQRAWRWCCSPFCSSC